jgi:hypothetical protein
MFIPNPGSEFFHPASRVKKIPDPGSRIKKIPDPGARAKKIPDPDLRIQDLDPQLKNLSTYFFLFHFFKLSAI